MERHDYEAFGLSRQEGEKLQETMISAIGRFLQTAVENGFLFPYTAEITDAHGTQMSKTVFNRDESGSVNAVDVSDSSEEFVGQSPFRISLQAADGKTLEGEIKGGIRLDENPKGD